MHLIQRLSSPQKDELDDIPIELSKVQSVKVTVPQRDSIFKVFAGIVIYSVMAVCCHF